ncbi:hypothetical protein RUND412_008753 [Rhizina undulata]
MPRASEKKKLIVHLQTVQDAIATLQTIEPSPAPRTSIEPLRDSRPAPPQIEILAGPVVPDEIDDFSNFSDSDDELWGGDEGEDWGEGDLATGALGNLLRLGIEGFSPPETSNSSVVASSFVTTPPTSSNSSPNAYASWATLSSDYATALRELEGSRYWAPQSRTIPAMSLQQWYHQPRLQKARDFRLLFRMLPEAFDRLLAGIETHRVFWNRSNVAQTPVRY